MTLLFFALGLVLLVGGAEALVRGASRLGAALGISPLVLGLTVVAYGTSSPELAVSVMATIRGQSDLALGNVLGSNTFNVLFILGASAILTPLVVAAKLVRVDVPIMVGGSLLLMVMAADGRVSRLDGGLLLLALLAYTIFCVRQARRERTEIQQEFAQEFGRRGSLAWNVGFIVGGLVLLTLGSRWLVAGAMAAARALGVSELIIGLTIVAAGTSLPEVATSLLAAWRGERDIAVGNVVGSNIFNVLGVLGLAGLVASAGVAVPLSASRFDIPVMVAVAVACLPIFFTGFQIARWEGALLFAYYIAYTAFLILDATDHDRLPALSWVMLAYVLPLTAVGLAVSWWRSR